MISKPKSLVLLVLSAALTAWGVASAHAQPVYLQVTTDSGNDTLFLGRPGSLLFNLDANGANVAGLELHFEFRFTNGNFIGPVEHGSQFFFSPEATAVFETRDLNVPYGLAVTDPDTLVWFAVDWDTVGWVTSGEIARLTLTPLDTGTVLIDSAGSPIWYRAFNVVDHRIEYAELTVLWTPATITVVPCPVRMGDTNGDGKLTISDVVLFVGWVYRGGTIFTDPEVGDVNCSGNTHATDIIYLVNYLFRGGPAPCGCFPL